MNIYRSSYREYENESVNMKYLLKVNKVLTTLIFVCDVIYNHTHHTYKNFNLQKKIIHNTRHFIHELTYAACI